MKDEEITLPPVLPSTSLQSYEIDTVIVFLLQMRYQNSERLSDLPEVTEQIPSAIGKACTGYLDQPQTFLISEFSLRFT